MKDSKYFRLEELLKSDKALAAQIENLPSWTDVDNLLDLAVSVLDPDSGSMGTAFGNYFGIPISTT